MTLFEALKLSFAIMIDDNFFKIISVIDDDLYLMTEDGMDDKTIKISTLKEKKIQLFQLKELIGEFNDE